MPCWSVAEIVPTIEQQDTHKAWTAARVKMSVQEMQREGILNGVKIEFDEATKRITLSGQVTAEILQQVRENLTVKYSEVVVREGMKRFGFKVTEKEKNNVTGTVSLKLQR